MFLYLGVCVGVRSHRQYNEFYQYNVHTCGGDNRDHHDNDDTEMNKINYYVSQVVYNNDNSILFQPNNATSSLHSAMKTTSRDQAERYGIM